MGLVPFSQLTRTLRLPLQQRFGQVLRRSRVRVRAGADHGADGFVRQRREDARRPEEILGPRVRERRVRILRLPVLGLEVGRLDAAERRDLGVRHLDPRPDVEAKRQHRDERRPRLPEELVAGAACSAPAACRCRASSRSRAGDGGRSSGCRRRTSVSRRVDAARIVVVEPRAEGEQTAQLAPVLVRKDVVRIVRAACRSSGTVRPACRRAPCWRGRGSCRPRSCAARSSRSSTSRVCPSAAGRACRSPCAPSPMTSASRADRREVVLGDVVAEGVEELRRDDLGAARHLRVRRRIELDEVDLPGLVANRESRGDAFASCRETIVHVPAGPCPVSGPFTSWSTVHRRASEPVGEPARVGHLVDRVDVDRARSSFLSPAPRNEFSAKS